jgi:hypothetical protein
MNRRGFLKAFGLTAAGIALLPEILEEPTSRTFFLPPRGGWDLGQGDFTTASFRYKATERYSYGWTDPRGLIGTPEPDTYIVTQAQMKEYNLTPESLDEMVKKMKTYTHRVVVHGEEVAVYERHTKSALHQLIDSARISSRPSKEITKITKPNPFLTSNTAWYLKT